VHELRFVVIVGDWR